MFSPVIQNRTTPGFFWILCVFVLLGPSVAFASAAPASNRVVTQHVAAQLVPEHLALAPGQSSTIALKLIHQPHWHTYWRTPGDSGMPTQIRWRAPPGVEIGELQWPAPRRLPFGPLVNFGYEGEVWLLAELRLASGYTERSVTLGAQAEWLVCKITCIPESGEFQLTLPVAASVANMHLNREVAVGFRRTRARLPADASGWLLNAISHSKGALLHLTPPAELPPLQAVTFFPYHEGIIEPSAAQIFTHTESNYSLDIPRAAQPLEPMKRLSGILVAEGEADAPPYVVEFDVPVETLDTQYSQATGAASVSLLVALIFAFAGGMILNLMPCVFPVLSIKVLGFANDSDSAQVRRKGLFYAIGVVASFWLLALTLFGLRAAGEQLGWGFQLQSPLVVAGLALLFFLLALNLSGFFDIGNFLPSRLATVQIRHPDLEALLSGGLAVAVASPCTGPFLGVALGYAVTQTAGVSLAVFTALGLGMALPYVLLTRFSRVRHLLPRPGPWMEGLRQFLAFPLYATVIWLAWVLGVQVGIGAVINLLAAAWLVTLGLWFTRRFQTSVPVRRIGLGVALAALVPVTGIVQSTPGASPSASAAGFEDDWGVYSAATVSRLTAESKTFFVDFTAAWCVTCQVNKRLVLDAEDIKQVFRERGIIRLRADWTRRNPEITRALEKLGRTGVPVYLLQRPAKPPQLLPELLTKTIILEALTSSGEETLSATNAPLGVNSRKNR